MDICNQTSIPPCHFTSLRAIESIGRRHISSAFVLHALWVRTKDSIICLSIFRIIAHWKTVRRRIRLDPSDKAIEDSRRISALVTITMTHHRCLKEPIVTMNTRIPGSHCFIVRSCAVGRNDFVHLYGQVSINRPFLD